jgi:hypothetical protein
MIPPPTRTTANILVDWVLIGCAFIGCVGFADRSFVWVEAGPSIRAILGSGISATSVLFLALVFGYGQYFRRRRYWTAVVFFFVPAVVAVVGFLGGVLACIWRLVSSTG